MMIIIVIVVVIARLVQPILLHPFLDLVGNLPVIGIRKWIVGISKHAHLRKKKVHGVAAVLVDCRCHKLEALSSDADSWRCGAGRVNLKWKIVAPDDQMRILGEPLKFLQGNGRSIRSGYRRTVKKPYRRLLALREWPASLNRYQA